MDGWVAWSIHFRESGSTGTVTLHGVGWRWDLRFSTSYHNFNEDGVMLLMRRTGWARTYISHGNGWNDMGMVSMAGLSGTHTLLSREKGSLYTQFSQISMTGANVGAVQ
jgi:hypothetical protein